MLLAGKVGEPGDRNKAWQKETLKVDPEHLGFTVVSNVFVKQGLQRKQRGLIWFSGDPASKVLCANWTGSLPLQLQALSIQPLAASFGFLCLRAGPSS